MASPLGIALAKTGLSTGAGLVNSALNLQGQWLLQQDAQDFNSQEAAIARDWQSQEAATARSWQSDEAALARDFALSYDNTKYQRAVSDLQAAGFNPAMIAGTLGTNSPVASSATSVGSSTGNSASSSVGHFNSGFGSTFSHVLSSAINAAQFETLRDDKIKAALLANTSKQINKVVEQMEDDGLSDYQRDLLARHGRLDDYLLIQKKEKLNKN